jgi:uncharacterized SAM-binding protein YcdF (DUF218 family)
MRPEMLLSPFAALLGGWLLLAAGVWWQRRAARWVGALLALAGLVGATPLVGNVLVGAIERAAPASDAACPAGEAVVLLSGGLARPPRDAEDFAALTPRTLERIGGLRRRPEWHARPLVIAGGGPYPVSEARVIAALLRRLGPMPESWLLEETSTTTWENAAQVRLLRPGLRRIVLATSALHLPRARVAFESFGFEVCGWPLHREAIEVEGPGMLWPGTSAARKTEAALHEWVGGWLYRWRAARGASSSP